MVSHWARTAERNKSEKAMAIIEFDLLQQSNYARVERNDDEM